MSHASISSLTVIFVNMISGGKTTISCTKIEDSIYGHLCVYKADESMEKSQVEKIEIEE